MNGNSIVQPEPIRASVDGDFVDCGGKMIYGTHSIEAFTLRRFRDKVLYKTWLGRWIIKFYYNSQPATLPYLKKYAIAKAVMRGVFTPVLVYYR